MYFVVLRKSDSTPLLPESDEDRGVGTGRRSLPPGACAGDAPAAGTEAAAGEQQPQTPRGPRQPVTVQVDFDGLQKRTISVPGIPERQDSALRSGADGTVYLHGISDSRLLKSKGYFVNPHPAAIVLARVLSALHNTFGLQTAAVTVLEPASERGNAGVDELQEQTVNLLNFQQLESKVFAGQLAFNVLPEREAAERAEKRILEHLTAILGKTFPKPMITAVQAPVFHSHAFSLFVHLLAAPSAVDLAVELERAGVSLDAHASQVSVVGKDTVHAGIRADANHQGAYSLWLVADNMRIAASNAIQTAEHIMLAPALGT